MHKYPNKPARDWVKKSQKYRPPGSSVTYSVPLADMVRSCVWCWSWANGYVYWGAGGHEYGPVPPSPTACPWPTWCVCLH